MIRAALSYVAAGLSVIPVLADSSKRPLLRSWNPYRLRLAREDELASWFSDSAPVRGLALVCGPVSGNLECLDFDDPDALRKVVILCRENGCADIVDKLSVVEISPRGGHHVWYRCSSKVGGNVGIAYPKIASPEGAAQPFLKGKALIETRGDGGYAIVDPSPGACHESGKPYKLLRGCFEEMPVLTPEEREVLHAICGTLNEWIEETPKGGRGALRSAATSLPSPASDGHSAGAVADALALRPGDDYALRGDYSKVLEAHGWTQTGAAGDKGLWRRPGKTGRSWSATSNYAGANVFYVFSTNAFPFEAGKSYSPLAVYAYLEHGGDFKEAAKALGKLGYGAERSDPEAAKRRIEARRKADQESAERLNGSCEAQGTGAAGDLLPPLWPVPGERAPTPTPDAVADDAIARASLPLIETNDRYLHEKGDEAYAAWILANRRCESEGASAKLREKLVFNRGGTLHWLSIDDKRRAKAAVLGPTQVRHCLARVAYWVSTSAKRGEVRVDPPYAVVEDVLARQSYHDFPPLDIVVTAPVLAPDGQICTEPGYCRSASVYYHAAWPLQIGDVTPTAERLAWAKEMLLSELLGDFPFRDEASVAHALGLILLPFVRQVVGGKTPLHAIDAPAPGTGKSLLADVCTRIFVSGGCPLTPETEHDEEWRKSITATLSDAPSHVIFDNLTRPFTAASVNAVLTADYWTDRLLGVSRRVVYPVRCVWVATANNIALSDESARRTSWIRLDAGVEAPSKRKGFRHRDLIRWTDANRADLIRAALTLVSAWQAAGRPAWSGRTLGSYEHWSEVIGGILDVAGVPGFLSNSDELMRKSDHEGPAWHAFVEAWAVRFGSASVGAAELFPLAQEHLAPAGVYRGKDERGERTAFGMKLRKKADRVFGGWKIAEDAVRHSGAMFRLVDPKRPGNLGNLGNLFHSYAEELPVANRDAYTGDTPPGLAREGSQCSQGSPPDAGSADFEDPFADLSDADYGGEGN